MPPRDYVRYLDYDGYPIRIRVEFETDRRGQVIRFTVQLEIEIAEMWLPVVRFDTEHNEAHIDLLDPDGREYDKQWLGIHLPYNATLTRATDELSENYGRHVRRFLEQKRRTSDRDR